MYNRQLLVNPLFFSTNRVWRCYQGGKLLAGFLDNQANGEDDNFPEEWLASVTVADNQEQQQAPDEGLSKVKNSNLLFADLLKDNLELALGNSPQGSIGILSKFLDSATRLPIQCHPDKDFAKKYYSSEYGKTESWLILATRKINGEEPYILLGFKPNIDKEKFCQAVQSQNISVMVDFLHKFPVKPGETYFIPGGIPHAIGPGLLLLEVQEPTDFVVQPEQYIGNVELTPQQMFGGLDFATAMACFDYKPQTAAAILKTLKLSPRPKQVYSEALLETLIDSKQTDCFNIDKLTIIDKLNFACDRAWHLGVVISGTGTLKAQETCRLKPGDCFFISNQIKNLQYSSASKEAPLQIYLISRNDANQNSL